MENNGHKKIFNTYVTILEDEIAVFSGFAIQIEGLKEVVKKKNWEELEATINMMNETGKAISYIEEKRNSTYTKLKKSVGINGNVQLRDVLRHLNLDMSRKIAELSSQLKYEVIRVQSTAKSLGYYVHGIYDLIYHLLEELFPYTKGKIYSREGKTKKANQEPVMVNKEL
jgi:hypothetical protein